MRDIALHVGFHSLTTLRIANDWRRVPMHRLLYAAPALRFVETLHISIAERNSSFITPVEEVNRFIELFSRLRRLYLAAYGKPIFDWSSFLCSEGALKLPELVAGTISNFSTNVGPSVPSEFDFLRYCFDCSRLAEGVGKFVKVQFEVATSRSFLATSLRRIAKADRTITVQFGMEEEPNLATDKFSTQQMEQDERNITHYKSRNSSISVYREHAFVTVTNDPSLDPFIRVSF